MQEPAGLDVVIVSYRSRELLRACLESLDREPPSRPMRVHVVDNDSRDGTAELVRTRFPAVAFTEAGGNRGFSAANNVGIRAGRAPYVLVLNPDTRVLPGALDRLLAVLDERDEVGLCGPRLEREDGSFDHAARRAFPTPLGALGHFTGIGRRAGAPRALAQYRAPAVESGPVDAVNGACMLLRRRALDEVGLFDEGYWMYMEDLDLCYRLAAAGWVTWYEPAAVVVHVKAGTSGAVRAPRLNRAFHYGMARFYRTHYAPRHGRLFNAAIYGGIGAKLAVSLARNAVRSRRGRP